MKEIFEGVYRHDKRIFTKNLTPGKRVYNERLVTIGGVEYRSWNPYRSKMAGAILKGCKTFPIKRDSHVLYLGVATGTTASHFSDIAREGIIYGVEISFKAMKNFAKLCMLRKNMIPIMEDANKPYKYEAMIEKVDVIYQDIAQRNQVDIFLKNMKRFSPENAVIMVKARSIDISAPTSRIYDNVKREIGKNYDIMDVINLSPYAKDHIAIFV